MSDWELWTAVQAAEHLGYRGPHAAASARRTLSRRGVAAVEYRPTTRGRVQALYDAGAVRDAGERRLPSGYRSDLVADERQTDATDR